MKVLITGSGGPATEALWCHWSSHEVFFADAIPERIHPCVPIDRIVSLPFGYEEEFFSEMHNLQMSYNFDLIISQVDEELIKLNELVTRFNGLEILTPALDFVTLCLDKYELSQSLKLNGISEPNSRPLESSLISKNPHQIFKPRRGRGSRGLFFTKETKQFELISDFLKLGLENYLVQDWIKGSEYTVQMIAKRNGELAAIVPLRVLEKRGSTTNCIVDLDFKVVDFCQLIHNTYKPKGVYNIQLIKSPEKEECFLIEINPRVSTTMCVALELGIDPIAVYFSGPPIREIILPKQVIELRRHTFNSFLLKSSKI